MRFLQLQGAFGFQLQGTGLRQIPLCGTIRQRQFPCGSGALACGGVQDPPVGGRLFVSRVTAYRLVHLDIPLQHLLAAQI